LTADVQWTEWKKIDEFKTTYSDQLWTAILGAAGEDVKEFRWESRMQLRAGIEYMQGPLAFRVGYYNDPSPAPDQTMNILLPSYDFNVFTVGLGYNVSGVQIDLGFEYLQGKKRNIPFEVVTPGFDVSDPDYASAMPGTYTMNIVVPTVSISYKF
jgi:long-chain fatty acid transport protein